MEVSDLLLTFCVWGMAMLQVVFNIEAGNYYSKSTFIMTLIKEENLGSFIYSGVVMCFYPNKLRVPGYPKISNFGYPGPEITENA